MRQETVKPFQVKVECYAGYKSDETPVRFRFGERVFQVEEVIDRWYEPDKVYFKVRADDGNFYILRRGDADSWTLESYRQGVTERGD